MAVTGGIVFDLDDTLTLERDYVRSGFQFVADWLGESSALTRDEIFAFLWEAFENGVRGDTFQRLLTAYAPLQAKARPEDLVRVYRSHSPQITLLPELSDLLGGLQRQGCRVGLLSDGPLESQQAKVAALGLETYCAPVVLTDRWGREFWKPHRRGYEHFARVWGLPNEMLTYVGDNPEKDFVTPRRLGWHTVRLRMPEQLRSHQQAQEPCMEAAVEIASLQELSRVLRKRQP
jgi:putative hydrolase of the HAD superfamily